MADIRAFFSNQAHKKKGKKKGKQAKPEVIDVESDDDDFVKQPNVKDFFSQKKGAANSTKQTSTQQRESKAHARKSKPPKQKEEPTVETVEDDDDDDDEIDEEAALAVLMEGEDVEDDTAANDGSGAEAEASDPVGRRTRSQQNSPRKKKGTRVRREMIIDEDAEDEESAQQTQLLQSPKKTRAATSARGSAHASPRKKKAAGTIAKPKKEESIEVIEDHEHDNGSKTKRAKTSAREKGRAAVKTEQKAAATAGAGSKPQATSTAAAAAAAIAGEDDDDDDDDDGGFVPAGLKKPRVKTSPKKAQSSASKTPATAKPADAQGAGTASGDDAGAGESKRSNFWLYKQRQNLAPPNLGQKELPEGAQNCLGGLKFVLTGVLDSIERDSAERLIRDHGGAVQKSVSGRVDYIVAGMEAGPSKMKKAEDLKLKVVDEDGLFNLIRTLPEKPFEDMVSPKKKKGAAKKGASTQAKPGSAVARRKQEEAASASASASASKGAVPSMPTPRGGTTSAVGELWTVKYAPRTVDKIVGQSGAKSNAKKLRAWLDSWHEHLPRKNNKPTKNDTGFDKRCALLVGPPGVGKTTTAKLVCEACGYEPIELNASDVRSRKLLEAQIGPLTRNCTMTQFYGTASKPRASKVAVIFDEVDGMAGNEDRGGVGEILRLIKSTKMPIICIANDVPQKLRRLRDIAFHLPFRKLQTKQIRSAMMSVAYKEGISINPIVLDRIIEGANGDIRQILNNMYMWSRNTSDFVKRQQLIDRDIKDATKYRKKTPWDCVPLFFRAAQRPKLPELESAFFQDFSAMPLFVQENYLRCQPFGKAHPVDILSTVADAAEAISEGELVGNFIMANMSFSALPVYGYVSCIRPGFLMRGSMRGRIEFSAWFGNNSKHTKYRRLCSELQQHMRKDISADARDTRLSYVPYLRTRLLQPLLDQGADGAETSVAMMNAYNLTRSDWDSVHELSQLSGMEDPLKKVDSKAKTAFTRKYNSSVHMLPYAEGTGSKKKKKQKEPSTSEDMFGMGEEGEGGESKAVESGEEDQDDLTSSAMIKQKNKKKGKAGAASKKRGGGSTKGSRKKKAKRA